MSEWKLVPVEPTDAMINAAEAAHANSEFARQTDGQVYGSIYRAMLAAATAEAGNAVEDRNVWKRVVPPEEVGAEPDAERDAARYRWLRTGAGGCFTDPANFWGQSDEEIDAAIDAAMKDRA
jgi:hypothetical protein